MNLFRLTLDLSAGRRRWLASAGAALACAAWGLLPAMASAQEWPNRPVKIVIAVAAGSSGDTLARIMAPKLEAIWKQPVVVENRPGAGGIVGTEFVATATDGHTLLLGSQSSMLPKFTQKTLRFDPFTDLVPIYRAVNYQLILATNAPTAKKARNLAELIALSKTTDKGIFFAGTGPTSVFNLSMATLNRQMGLRYSTVDFNAVPAMNLAVMRDDAQILANTPSALKGQIDAGTLVPLAAINAERYPNLPDLPTVTEATGYKGYLPLLWAGFFAPKGVPAPVIERIGRDVGAVLADPALKKQVETTLTATVLRSSPAAFAKEIQEEAAVWKDLFQAMNYKPE